jgi:hypothetical protein
MSMHDERRIAAWLAGDPNADLPVGVCPTIAAFLSEWNNRLPEIERERLLKPRIPRIVGTKGSPSLSHARGYLALDWMVRVLAPAVLDLTPKLRKYGEALRTLEELRDIPTVRAAQPTLTLARTGCRDIWDRAQAPGLAAAEAALRAASGATKAAATAASRDAATNWSDRVTGEAAAYAIEAAERARQESVEAAKAAERSEDNDWDNANEVVGAVDAASYACDAAWAEVNDADLGAAEARATATDSAREAVWDAALSAAVSINVSLLESEVAALNERACELLDSMIALTEAQLSR